MRDAVVTVELRSALPSDGAALRPWIRALPDDERGIATTTEAALSCALTGKRPLSRNRIFGRRVHATR